MNDIAHARWKRGGGGLLGVAHIAYIGSTPPPGEIKRQQKQLVEAVEREKLHKIERIQQEPAVNMTDNNGLEAVGKRILSVQNQLVNLFNTVEACTKKTFLRSHSLLQYDRL